jgi:signal transduction histidine kinase/sugar lactone lactonase YvrE
VRAITQDPQGILWVGTEGGGLDRLDLETGRFAHYRQDAGNSLSLRNDDVLALYVDQVGYIWVGTRQGPDRLDPGTGRFSHLDLDGTAVRAFHEDAKGTLWIGTELDLWSLKPETGEVKEWELERSILSIHEDQQGNLWIGTFGHGLHRWDPTTGTTGDYRQADGLPSDVVYGILEDAQGHLWLSTNAGLSEFDPISERFVNYDESDGIQSKEFNAGAYCQSRNGEMFFGGVNGFNAFFPEGLATNLSTPPIVLSAVMQGNAEVLAEEALWSMEQVALRWPNNSFEFKFAALSYCQPQRNQYAYMLEGLDRDWFYVGPQRTGRYTNLPGKTYTLRVKGSNSDGTWNEQGVSLKIKVVPPFWATWWFRGAVAMLVVGVAIAGFRLRVRSIEARTKELERLVAERTSALADRTRETERRKQELEALYRADAELHRHLDLDQVLNALVDIAVDILGADKSSLVIWDDHHERLRVRVAQGYHPETLSKMTFSPGEGTVGHVATTGQPVAVRDTRTDPRVIKRAAITEPEGIRSYIQVPIEVAGEIFGVFSADYLEPRAFGADDRRLFLALAQRAATAIDTAQLHEQSQALAVVQERSRLARELHDAVTQTLFSSSLIAETVPELWETDPEEGRQLLQELRQLTRGALAEMRTLLLELRPAALIDTNLADLLRQLCDAATGRLGIPVSISVQGQCSLPPDVHVALYRIAQEALNNVVKHSEATIVTVTLRCGTAPHEVSSPTSEQVELQVTDNGKGFDMAQVPANRLGLGIIRERAQAIGASLEIESQPGKGTRTGVCWSPGGKE